MLISTAIIVAFPWNYAPSNVLLSLICLTVKFNWLVLFLETHFLRLSILSSKHFNDNDNASSLTLIFSDSKQYAMRLAFAVGF